MLIWRGYGWLTPVIAFLGFIIAAIFSEAYIKSNDWVVHIAFALGAIFVGAFGYYINTKKRRVLIDEETGEKIKSHSHTFFMIPVQYWGIIIPAFFILSTYLNMQRELNLNSYLEAPAVNDIYLVDTTKIDSKADKKFQFEILKVKTITDSEIEFYESKLLYDRKKDARKALREEEMEFLTATLTLTKEELLSYKKVDGIYSITRN